ncbi:DnaB-like helicase C-terminal domain-containing protein [Bacillus toyonensis]|uniref:DnaB-like helicase C-terminal domain-containing protein n=1 Tax=Bacillus toyonensis TaxID=155322 RepID=UPI0014448296|nr:DnaB-like helicase C-terminal domain-containing protein [Bacillus toyonensis]MBH0356882.1 DNA helicase [Bacillus toyonensis biovar Thuringiensis]NKW97296.1 DNA helicase [Bacillus toyonensis]
MNKYQVHYENECYILGMMIHDNSLIYETKLRTKHYLNRYNRNLFKIMKELQSNDKPVDMMSLSQIGEDKMATFNGISTLSNLYELGILTHNFKYIEDKMIEFIAVNEALLTFEDFKEKSKFTHSYQQLNKLLSEINNIPGTTMKSQPSFKEKLENRILMHSQMPLNGISGTPTGFNILDKGLDGWQPSDLIVVAARPSVGKTAFVLESMRRGAHQSQEYMGTFFSCEMDENKIIDRWIAAEGKIPVATMNNPNKFFHEKQKYWEKYHEACGKLAELSINVRPEKNIDQIRTVIRQIVKENPDRKHFFAIDHLGHIDVNESFQNNHLKFTYIMKQLKEIQKEHGVPIMLVAQLNRSVEGKQDKAPTMADIRESGSIEEIADLIIFPHRPAYFNREQQAEEIHNVELIIAKNRNGFVGTLPFQFVKKTNIYLEKGI